MLCSDIIKQVKMASDPVWFVYYLDNGIMLTFNVPLFDNVVKLQQTIEERLGIPVARQVLLVSGGKAMPPKTPLCNYQAVGGVDSNPFYLSVKRGKCVPMEFYTPYVDEDDDEEKRLAIDDTVQRHLSLPPDLATINKRANLARSMEMRAQEKLEISRRIVHDQHLQQQGWAAVVANFEDHYNCFRRVVAEAELAIEEYISKRNIYLKYIDQFPEDLKILERIPVLPTLLKKSKSLYLCQEDLLSEAQKSKAVVPFESEGATKEHTLVSWLTEISQGGCLLKVIDACTKGLSLYQEEGLRKMMKEIREKIKCIESPSAREIKGLSGRLSSLDEILREFQKVVQEQTDLSQSFQKNSARAVTIKDASIIPDLCESHYRQLSVMYENHKKCVNMKQKIVSAKAELCTHLIMRVEWVTNIENMIAEYNDILVNDQLKLQKLNEDFTFLEQVNKAPVTYFSAVAEAYRRRIFSQSFLKWSSDLANQVLAIYNEEVRRRKEFRTDFEGHFIAELFPGMEDMPPPFAIEAPKVFDSYLPEIVQEDFEKLLHELPEFADYLNIPDTSHMNNLFNTRYMLQSAEKVSDDSKPVEEKLEAAVRELGGMEEGDACPINIQGLPHLKDLDKGCESETDTEEFEKVGQTPLDLHFDKEIPSVRPGKQEASTLTEVGDRSTVPPKKPPRLFQKHTFQTHDDPSISLQRTLSISSTQSNTESFTNLKNPSLESIDELSSLKNFTSNTESCFNSHHQQSHSILGQSKSISPHTPQSPREVQVESPNSPFLGHQHINEFASDEYYIDESLPSSLSIENAAQDEGEIDKQLDTANNVVALLQDNLQTSHEEREKLKTTTTKLVCLTKQAIQELRKELDILKKHYTVEAETVSEHLSSTRNQIHDKISESTNKHIEAINKIMDEHKFKIDSYEASVESLTKQTNSLTEEKTELENRLAKMEDVNQELSTEIRKVNEDNQQKLEELEVQIGAMEKEKERAVKEAHDQLSRDHKTELENIRSRYRLMTMERSPSDSSLERVEKLDAAGTRESMMQQVWQEHSLQKEEAVSEAVNKEVEKWQHNLNEKVKEMTVKFEQEKTMLIQEVAKRISEEKDKQIDTLRERESNLALECRKYKYTIQQLADSSNESDSVELQAKVEELEREKCKLETEIEKLKKDLAASVATFEGKTDAATSPIKHHKERESASRSSASSSSNKRTLLNIDSCQKGDTVFIFWDRDHESFRILQNDRFLYFLHLDYLKCIGLKIADKQPNKHHEFAEVIEKEYCHARKSENRYKVPKGSRFYRVKVKPTPQSIPKDIVRSYHHTATLQQTQMWQSQTVPPTGLEFATDGGSSLPSSPTRNQPTIVEENPDDTAGVSAPLAQPKRVCAERQPSITVENMDRFKLELSESGNEEDESQPGLLTDPGTNKRTPIQECGELLEDDLINFSEDHPPSVPDSQPASDPDPCEPAANVFSQEGEDADKNR